MSLPAWQTSGDVAKAGKNTPLVHVRVNTAPLDSVLSLSHVYTTFVLCWCLRPLAFLGKYSPPASVSGRQSVDGGEREKGLESARADGSIIRLSALQRYSVGSLSLRRWTFPVVSENTHTHTHKHTHTHTQKHTHTVF